MSQTVPLVILGFNRAVMLERTLGQLLLCDGIEDTEATLFLDAPQHEDPKVAETRAMAHRFRKEHWPSLRIVERPDHLGCRLNVTGAISETLAQHGRAVIVEDDILVSRTFLTYMNEALTRYASDTRIWCINGYSDPFVRLPYRFSGDVFLAPRNMAWGWGVWADRWNAVAFDPAMAGKPLEDPDALRLLNQRGKDLVRMLRDVRDGKLDTWDVQCSCHMALHDLYAVEPVRSLTKNTGFGTGSHCTFFNPVYAYQHYYDFLPVLNCELIPNKRILSRYRRAFDFPRIGWTRTCRILRIVMASIKFGHKFLVC